MKYKFLLLILSVVAPSVFGENKPGLDSSDIRERCEAVELITDQAVLTKLALESKYTDVRFSTARKLTDQTVLVKILLEEKKKWFASVRLEK